LLEKYFPDLAQFFSNVIVIAIEILIRIDRTLIEKILPDFDKEMLSWCE